MKLPVKLQQTSLNQVDQILHLLALEQAITLSVEKFIVDEHIATSVLLTRLSALDHVSSELIDQQALDLSHYSGSAKSQALCFTEYGETYVLSGVKGAQLTLTSYFHLNEIVSIKVGTWSELKKTLSLTDSLLLVCKTDRPAERSQTEKTADSDHKSPDQRHYVYQHFIQHRGHAWRIIAVAIMLALLGVVTPLGFQTFADKILPYSASQSLIVVTVLLLLAAIATNVLKYFHDYQQSVLFAKYQNGLGKEVFQRLLGMDIPFFDRRPVGELSKLVEQVQEASNFLIRQLLSTVVSVISLLVVLPILFVYSTKLAAIVFGIGLLMAATIALALKPWRQRVEQAYSYDAGFQSTLIETLKGIKTIKSLANESYFRHRANTSLEHNLYGNFHVERLGNIVGAVVGFQSQLITIAVIFFGAQSVFNNEMTIGQLIAFNMLANNVVSPLVALVMTASGWETFKLAKRKLSELTPPSPQALQLDDAVLDLKGDIEFEDVWFKYPDSEEYVLKGINLTIRQDEIMGIVGGSGSGKSTLASLLLGFYVPDKGKVKINGHDINTIKPEVLRARISSVQQTSFLFSTSVLENIHLGRLSSTFDDIQSAVDKSGSQTFVDAMPHKIMTPLSEDGENLSGGQRQRLAIARALVRNSDILLFDEATSALDNQTEDKIKTTIYLACQQKTGIIIAHRLNTLSYCDRLVVMNQGEIEIVGTHDELLATDNSYRTMWQSALRRDTEVRKPVLKEKMADAV